MSERLQKLHCIQCLKQKPCLLFELYTPDYDGQELHSSLAICKACFREGGLVTAATIATTLAEGAV